MPSLSPLAPTTPLAAVNRMLAAVGDAPITDLTNSTREDVTLATEILKGVSLEVQSIGWRFNREFGFELNPSGQITWQGADGTVETLNVFAPPATLLKFDLTGSVKQNTRDLDLVIRPPRRFTGVAQVFYDRAKNRDGLLASQWPVIHIDPVWYFEFEQLPQTVRNYITVRAARQFIQQSVGARDLVGYGEQDEVRALQAAYLDQGEEDEYNLFETADLARMYYGRRPGPTGTFDSRSSTRTV